MRSMIVAMAAGAALLTVAGAAAAAQPLYENPGDISAYVNDWAVGPQFTNYAFDSGTLAFVGSWEVDDGPSWTTVPTAYSGLTAAVQLFGGSTADYFISTADNTSADINHLAWVSTWGGACGGDFPCGTQVAEGFVHGTGGGVPEPAAWGLMIMGFGGIGAALRRRRGVATFA